MYQLCFYRYNEFNHKGYWKVNGAPLVNQLSLKGHPPLNHTKMNIPKWQIILFGKASFNFENFDLLLMKFSLRWSYFLDLKWSDYARLELLEFVLHFPADDRCCELQFDVLASVVLLLCEPFNSDLPALRGRSFANLVSLPESPLICHFCDLILTHQRHYSSVSVFKKIKCKEW